MDPTGQLPDTYELIEAMLASKSLLTEPVKPYKSPQFARVFDKDAYEKELKVYTEVIGQLKQQQTQLLQNEDLQQDD